MSGYRNSVPWFIVVSAVLGFCSTAGTLADRITSTLHYLFATSNYYLSIAGFPRRLENLESDNGHGNVMECENMA